MRDSRTFLDGFVMVPSMEWRWIGCVLFCLPCIVSVVMHTADDGELGDRDADSTSGRLEWLTSGAALSELVSIADRALSSLGALFHSTSVAAESVSTRAHEFTPSPTAPPAVAVERTAAQGMCAVCDRWATTGGRLRAECASVPIPSPRSVCLSV